MSRYYRTHSSFAKLNSKLERFIKTALSKIGYLVIYNIRVPRYFYIEYLIECVTFIPRLKKFLHILHKLGMKIRIKEQLEWVLNACKIWKVYFKKTQNISTYLDLQVIFVSLIVKKEPFAW